MSTNDNPQMKGLLIITVTFLVIMCAMCLKAKAQVINGSFENASCPTLIAQQPDNWVNVRCDVDLISGCVESGQADYSNVGTPCNWFGCQQPQEGNNYIAICLASCESETREWVKGEIEPLQAGRMYKISFYYSKADRYGLVSNNIGVYFGHLDYQFPYVTDYSQIDYSKVVSTFETNVDSTSWTLFEGYYVAAGGENEIVLGNFYPDSETKIEHIGYYSHEWHYAYYYIDNVQLHIQDINSVNEQLPSNKKVAYIADAYGRVLDTYQTGINIVVYTNGTTQKVFK